MPIYEYICPNCKTKIELKRKMSDRNYVVVCEKCGEFMIRKIELTNFIPPKESGCKGGVCKS